MAYALYQESLDLRRALEDKRGIAYALGIMGQTAHQQGDYRRATALFEEGLALCREMGVQQFVA